MSDRNHPPSFPANPAIPSIAELRQRTQEKFGRRPCQWQCEVAQALLRGDKDLVCISGTGSGKTLTFWMPLLFRPQGIQIVVTPLNILGTQNEQQLGRVGISAINITGETATYKNIQDILAGKYRVIAVNPEMAFKHGGVFESVWKDKVFMSRVISVVWDEAHLITAWASFRPDLGEASRLRNTIPDSVRFLLPSATMPESVLKETIEVVRLHPERLRIVRRSNDRPNVYLTVRKIRHPISSFRDLEFLIPKNWTPTTQTPRFVVFFDNIEDSIKAAETVRKRLPPAYRNRVLWFNADNTATFREKVTKDFMDHKVIGLFCTDAFGMGIDIPDIELIVQWRPTCGMNALWQRIGRAARGAGREALAVLFVDAKYFDDEKEAAAKRAEKRKESAAKKAAEKEAGKRKRTDEGSGRASKSRRARGQDDVTENLCDESELAMRPYRSASLLEQLSEYERLRVEYEQVVRARNVAEAEKKKGGRKAAAITECLAPELDAFVNAALRTTQCYRKPILAYYENDRLGIDNHACQEGADVCPRCILKVSPVCCSLCSPNHPMFDILPPLDAPIPKSTTPRASNVATDYNMGPSELELRKALHEYRREQTIREHGRAHLYNSGYGSIMGDKILQRIIDCARANKIRTLEGLYRETKWNRTYELGEMVLELVNKIYPPPEVAPGSKPGLDTSERVAAAGSSNDGAQRKAVGRQCSACGEYGHISELLPSDFPDSGEAYWRRNEYKMPQVPEASTSELQRQGE